MVGGLFCNFKPTRCTADIQTARTPDSLIALKGIVGRLLKIGDPKLTLGQSTKAC